MQKTAVPRRVALTVAFCALLVSWIAGGAAFVVGELLSQAPIRPAVCNTPSLPAGPANALWMISAAAWIFATFVLVVRLFRYHRRTAYASGVAIMWLLTVLITWVSLDGVAYSVTCLPV